MVITTPQSTTLTLIHNNRDLGAPNPRAMSVARGTPVRMGGLEGHAHDPVAVPQALHALALFGELGAGVDPALQPLAGYHGEHRPDESTRYGSGLAQDGGEP